MGDNRPPVPSPPINVFKFDCVFADIAHFPTQPRYAASPIHGDPIGTCKIDYKVPSLGLKLTAKR